MGNRPAWRHYALIAALTVLYFLAGKLGLEFFGLVHPSVAAVWPPTGVAIAALLLFGWRVWPALFVGAFLVNVTTAGSVATSLGAALGNTLEAVVAAYLVKRFAGGRDVFLRARDVFKFAGLAAFASTTISATIGVAGLTLGGYAPPWQFGSIWLTWWLGNAAGAILVTPLLVLWYTGGGKPWSLKRLVEALLLLAVTVVTAVFIFLEPELAQYPRSLFTLPLLVWAAFRFTQREVATVVAVMATIATWATIHGRGPFVMPTPNESLLVLQSFMAMIALTGLPLAALVGERAALLERERAARAEAETANRTKDEFLAMLSHELRNPLTAISAATAVLDRLEGPAGETSRWRDTIRRQTQHLTHLIDDLLDIARTTAGKMTLKRQVVDLAEAVERCVEALTSSGMTRHHRFDVQVAHAWAHADSNRLDQIITNLITNAIKYTPPGGTIRVQAHNEGEHAVVRVQDTGIGIAPEMLPQLFDPFTQGPQGPERIQGGLGLGLALVKRLAELQDGKVEAHSGGPGQGATFIVRLPGVEAPPPVQSAATPEGVRRARSYRILIVEDNADARQGLRFLLEAAGHEVHEAEDGRTGIEAALRLQPDFAIVDIGLPELNGYEVARRIKAANANVRLIAMTGYGRDEDRQQAREAGFDAHVLKPCDVEQVQQIMDGVAGQPRAVSPQAAR